MQNSSADYKKMWADFGRDKAGVYSDYKFNPNHRVGLTNHLRETLIYKFLNPQKSDIILDVGCASGRQLLILADKIKEGYGIDISKEFIDQADKEKNRLKVSNVHFAQAVSEEIPFPDSFFDKIVCAEVLEHVPDKDASLMQILRVLKKDGILVITVPNLNADATLWGRMMRFLGLRKFVPLQSFTEKDLNEHGDAHVREFTGKSLISWAKKNNLKVLQIKSVSFIDGPYFDKLIKIPLHVKLLRYIIIRLEFLIASSGLFWGRHLVVKLKK